MAAIFYLVAFTQVDYIERPVYTVKLVGDVATAKASTPAVQTVGPKPTPVEEKKPEPEPEEKDQMPAPPKEKSKPKPVEKKAAVPTTDITKTDAKPDSDVSGEQPGEGIPGPKGDEPVMGGVSIDGGNFPFASYINRMRQKIATTWEVPAGTEGLERSAVVYFRIHRDGSVSNVTVEKSSSITVFDRSCQRAVMDAAPMAPLPREYSEEYIGVHFSFLFQPSPP
jgi:TonB family protein